MPDDVKAVFGHAIDLAQAGGKHSDAKVMTGFGSAGVLEVVEDRQGDSTMALMFLDIDHFKSINDSLGHGAGDQVLCEFANRIRSALRVTDTAARLAGDEFVIVLEDVMAVTEVEVVAKKLLAIVRLPIRVSGTEITVTTSIGIAINQANDIAPEALIDQADRALYRVKEAGRDAFALEAYIDL